MNNKEGNNNKSGGRANSSRPSSNKPKPAMQKRAQGPKKVKINTIQQQIIFDSLGYQNLQKQTQLFLETKINNQTRKNNDALSLLQHYLKYFDDVFKNIDIG